MRNVFRTESGAWVAYEHVCMFEVSETSFKDRPIYNVRAWFCDKASYVMVSRHNIKHEAENRARRLAFALSSYWDSRKRD